MANRVLGTEVYCHECQHQWPRSEHGLTCPNCDSEFVEIVEDSDEEEEEEEHDVEPQQEGYHFSPLPALFSGFSNFLPNHQAYHGNHGNDRITRHHYHSNDGRFQFTSTTVRSPAPGGSRGGGGGIRLGMNPNTGPPGLPDDPLAPIFRNFNAILQGIAESQPNRGGIPLDYGYLDPNAPPHGNNYRNTNQPDAFPGMWPRDANRPQVDPNPLRSIQDIIGMVHGATNQTYVAGGHSAHPFAILAQVLGLHRNGEAVYSQVELDRLISQLVDRGMNGSGPAPASDEAIRALPKKTVDEEFLGPEGSAECSICMDAAELGSEVTVLPCKHWFHESCISAWLRQHDTCPHCRQGVTVAHMQASANSQQRENQNSRASAAGQPGSAENPFVVPSSPSAGQSPIIPSRTRSRQEARQSPEQPNTRSQDRSSRSGSQPLSGLAGWMIYHFGGRSSS